MTNQSALITIETLVNAPIAKVWSCWTQPAHVMNWNHASDDWHCPAAENDLQVGGKFVYKMAARDGSFEFDFWGIHNEIREHEVIASTLGDNRSLLVTFIPTASGVKVVETFEAETQNSVDMQRAGWQMILDNFRNHVEGE
jgi:uncharacterized protein YndB with AHSA1/START domain